MVANIMINKKFQDIIEELFIRWRKLNISLVFIKQSCFSVPKEVRLIYTHYLIMKIHNKRELKQTAINHSDYKGFVKIYKKYASGSYFFLTIDTTLSAKDSLGFRKNVLDPL